MESHVLNTYHQARYRSIGHKIIERESLSEDSCKTSPEYEQPKQQYARYQHYWKGQDWSRNQTINMTRSQDTSSDEEENIEVQELSYEDAPADPGLGSEEQVEEQVLVEGDDYDVIQVYAVDPDLDLEASSDEEYEDFCISDVKDGIVNENTPHKVSNNDSQVLEGLNFNLDTPVVSNVDEYFIKEDKDKDILAVKDEPVVQDVDEYFIKEEPKPNVDDFFIKEKIPEEFDVSKPVNVDEFFVSAPKIPERIEQSVDQNVIDENVIEQNVIDKNIDQNQIDNADEPINESDLEVLPNIEDLKRFLLEDMSYSKFKHAQRSCSLPQSPMHNICLDIDDAKTCLSFEDLNLDLSDLTFDNEKDKSVNSIKSDDLPRTLTDEDINSFLITNKPENKATDIKEEDDLSHQDMEIEQPVESIVETVIIPQKETPKKIPEVKHSTPIKSTVLNFCIEKPAKKETSDNKTEVEDFVDVESCNDTVIPVLVANNLNSLLEQFEVNEKLNTKPKRVVKVEEKVKSASLTNGTRLQNAGVQLNKTKMRQILMPSTVNVSVRRSPSPVHSDHDYCSSKKRYSLPNIKGGQSLLKPEVLSSNNKILSSRHRSCKNKKVVYALSSDDESDKNKNKILKTSDDSDIKLKKISAKQSVKVISQPTRKKLSPVHTSEGNDKGNSSVIVKEACKASDTPCSRNSNGSIKLTIKNKSEVILNCDAKDSQKDKPIEKCKSSVSEKTEVKVKVEAQNNVKNKSIKNIKDIDSNKKCVSSIENNNGVVKDTIVVKEENRPKAEHFYTALFSNKQDVQVPQAMQIKSEKRSFEEEISILTKIPNKTEAEQPQKKKKLNLQEYKLRRCVGSNNSSAAVSPEAIFPDTQIPFTNDKAIKVAPNRITTDGNSNITEQMNNEAPKKIFDPIREASRKILMNTKKQKAEAMRKRDEDIVMSKIPKVDNLQLQPLISDAEMLKIVGMAPSEAIPMAVVEKPQVPANYQEIVMVSVGTNTDEIIFKELENKVQDSKPDSPTDCKSLINFRIKKSDHVLKQNIFDSFKRDKKSPVDERKPEVKIDKERFKDITATLKSVGKQVDTKKCTNSLFASIQDVVMKKAPDEISEGAEKKRTKSNSPKRKRVIIKTTIVRAYDLTADHGEDKIILHLGKDRIKPDYTTIVTQTDRDPEFTELIPLNAVEIHKTPPRKRNDSDMSMSSDSSPVRKESPKKIEKTKDKRVRSESKEKRSRSRERYDKFKRSRSPSRSRRRRRSHSKTRSRSRSRYRRYRRSDSPYRRRRRSKSYRRRSPSSRREYRSNRSRSRTIDARSSSKKRSPQHVVERKAAKSLTPPPRKPTISESSDSSSSSSSLSSSSSDESRKSRTSRSRSPYQRDDRSKEFRSYNSSEDRESNTPVEERRIVFVGKLEKDITKSSLRAQFSKFGPVLEVRLHSKEDGTRYGFVTYRCARDAWSAVEAAATFPHYDVGFGGRRAFCRQSYADLDGLEAKYTESAFHGQAALPPRRDDDMSFEQMLLEMKKKLSRRKDKRPEDKA